MRANGLKEEEEITLVDKTGVEWPSYVAFVRERGEFYMPKSWRRFCAANRFKEGETFALEFLRGEGTPPMLKFCSKDKVMVEQAARDKEEEEEAQEETETRFQKRARVSAGGGPSRCTRASNKSSADPGNLQPLQPCSIFDQVTKVKQSVVDTLTSVRQFRSELKIKEQNLEASLLEIDVLGEKVLEMNKILT